MTDDVGRLIAGCSNQGLDLAASLQAGWYNEQVAAPHRIEDFGDPQSEVVLIGNTRAIWPPFVRALRMSAPLRQSAHPMDRYVEAVVSHEARAIDVSYQVRWAHRAEPAHLSFQTMAQVAGLAWRSAASLSVHEVHGPWIAFRAAIVINRPLVRARPAIKRTCRDCSQGCEQALRTTLANPNAGWQDWLQVRDACPTGQASRYPEHQLIYHYTRSRAVLSEAISTVSA